MNCSCFAIYQHAYTSDHQRFSCPGSSKGTGHGGIEDSRAAHPSQDISGRATVDKANIERIAGLQQHAHCTMQVGDSMTMADSQLATTLASAFTHLIGQQQQQQLPSVMRWFQTCVQQSELAPVVGMLPC